MRKRLCVLLLALFTVLGFTACGGNLYDQVKLTVSTNEVYLSMAEDHSNQLVSDSQRVSVRVEAPKSLSKDIDIPTYGDRLGDQYVAITVAEQKDDGTYILEFSGIKTGYTEIAIKTIDGNRTEIIKVYIDVELKEMAFKDGIELVCEEGGKLDLNGNSRRYINFTPSATTQTDVEYVISDQTKNLYIGGDASELIKDNILDLTNFKISDQRELIEDNKCIIRISAKSIVQGKVGIDTKDTYLKIKVIKPFKFYESGISKIVLGVGNGNENFCNVTPKEPNENQVEYDLLFANPSSTNGETNNIESLDKICFFGGKIRIAVNYLDYKITIDDLNNEIISVVKTSTTIDGAQTIFIFDVNPKETGTQTLVFKVDYTGGESSGKYDGQFTKRIVVNFTVLNVPTAGNLIVNDAPYSAENTKLMVFTEYSSTFGTKVVISDPVAKEMTYKVSSRDSLIVIMDKNGDGVNGNKEFANGEIFYLKSNSNNTHDDSITVVLTTKFYNDQYGDGKEVQVYTTDIQIKLHISASVDNFELRDNAVTIKNSADLQPKVIYEFEDTELIAKDVISEIGLSNSSAGRITFAENKIMFVPNFKLDKYFTPSGTQVTLRMITGVSSTCRIEVGLDYVVDGDIPLLLFEIDKTNTGYFAGWNDDNNLSANIGNQFIDRGDTVSYMDKSGAQYTYTAFNYLALATNTTINFSVYRLFIYNGNIEKVAVNDGINIATNSEYMRWVRNDGGQLITGATTTVRKNGDWFEGTDVSISVEGFDNQVTIKAYIFEKITQAKLSKNTFTVYDATNLKDADVNKAFAELQLKITTANGDDAFDVINYGNLYQDYTMTDKDVVVTRLNGTEVKYNDLMGGEIQLNCITVDGVKLYKNDNNWFKNIFDAVSNPDKKLDLGLDNLKYSVLTEGDNSTTYYWLDGEWFETINDVLKGNKITDVTLTARLFELPQQEFRLETIYAYKACLSNDINTENREALINAIFKNGSVDVVYRGIVKQFNNVFDGNNFTVKIYNPTKSTSVKTNVNMENGLYLELDGEKSTSFTYEVLPTNTFNKDVFVEIRDVDSIGTNLNIAFAISKNGVVEYKNYKGCGAYVDGDYNNEEALFRVTLKDNKITIEYLGNKPGVFICYVGAIDQISDGQFNLKTEFNINIADGSEKYPYQIRSRYSFERFLESKRVVDGSTIDVTDKYYVLANDIVLNNTLKDPNYILKNNLSGVFKKYLSNGNIEENKYKIYGLKLLFTTDAQSYSFGLFANANNGLTITNVCFENVTVTAKGEFGSEVNIGVIFGNITNSVEINNCRVNGTISVVQNGTGAVNVGGMIGKTNTTISINGAPSTSTVNNNNINANIAINVGVLQRNNNDVNIGGIVGYADDADGKTTIGEVNVLARLTAYKYENTGALQPMDFAKANIGGVVGYASNIVISDTIIYPIIAGSSNLGGVAGCVKYAEINNTQVQMLYNLNMKNIIAGYSNVGGIIGTAETAKLEYDYVRSYTSQNITKYDGNVKVLDEMSSSYYGAIVLLVNPSDYTDGQYAGGIVGAVTEKVDDGFSLSINNCYFNSHIASNAYLDKEKVGGFIGYKLSDIDGVNGASVEISNSYFDGKAEVKSVMKLIYADADTNPDNNNIEYSDEPTTYTYSIVGDKNLKDNGDYVVVRETAVSKIIFRINETLNNTTINNVYAKLNGSLFSIENEKLMGDKVSYFGLTTKVNESTIIVFKSGNDLWLSAYRRDLSSSPIADSYEYYRLKGSSFVNNFDSFDIELLQTLIGYNFVTSKGESASIVYSKSHYVGTENIACETQNDIASVLGLFNLGDSGSSLSERINALNSDNDMELVTDANDYAYNQVLNQSNVLYNEILDTEIIAFGDVSREYNTSITYVKFKYNGKDYYINTNAPNSIYTNQACTITASDFPKFRFASIPTQKTIGFSDIQRKNVSINKGENDFLIDGDEIDTVLFVDSDNSRGNSNVGKLYCYSGVKLYIYDDVIVRTGYAPSVVVGDKAYTRVVGGNESLIGSSLYQYGGHKQFVYARTPYQDGENWTIYYYESNPSLVVATAMSNVDGNGVATINIDGVDYILENGVLVDALGQEYNLTGENRYYINEKLNINIENKVLTNSKLINIYNLISGEEKISTIQEMFTKNGFKNFDGEIYAIFKNYFRYNGSWYEKRNADGTIDTSSIVTDIALINKLNTLNTIKLTDSISYVEINEFTINAEYGVTTYYTSTDSTSEYYMKWYEMYEKQADGKEVLSQEITDTELLAKIKSVIPTLVEGSTAIKCVSFEGWKYGEFNISDQFVLDKLNANKVEKVTYESKDYYYSSHWYLDESHNHAVIDTKILSQLKEITVASGESYKLNLRYYKNGDNWVDESGNTIIDYDTLTIIAGLTIKTAEDGRQYVEYEKTFFYYAFWSNGEDKITDADLISQLDNKLNNNEKTTISSATIKLYMNGDKWSYDENYFGGESYENNVKDDYLTSKIIGSTNLQQDFKFTDHNGVTYNIKITTSDGKITALYETDDGRSFEYLGTITCDGTTLSYKVGNVEYRVPITSGGESHKWVITNKINGGLPVMIKPYLVIVGSEIESKYGLWFDTLATLNLIINDFAVDPTTNKYYTIDGDEHLQGHILYNEDTAILMYNTPVSASDSKTLNTYKMSYGINNNGYYVASINGKILEISALKINADTASQMIIASSNQDVVYVDTNNDNYIAIIVRNIGQATLTFYNLKDDGINVKFNIVVVRGFTDFKVTNDRTGESVAAIDLTVGVAEDYNFGFENILDDVIYPANTSGFQITLKSVDGNTNISSEETSTLKLGSELLDGRVIGKTLDFNYTSTLNLLALNKVGNGEFKISITPFIFYNNEKVYVSSLAKDVTINIIVEALNVLFTEDNSKISAQNEKEVSVVVYSNNGNGRQEITLSASGIKDIVVKGDSYNASTNLVEKSGSDATLLKIRFKNYTFEKDNNSVGEVAIHKHLFTFVLSMNMEEYTEIYSGGNNPLYYDRQYLITASSGSKSSTFDFTIAPNPVSSLDAYFYPEKSETSGAYNQADIWSIAPGKEGILKLEITPDYNNILIVEVVLDEKYVNYVDVSQQYISYINLDNNEISYSRLSTTNTLVGNKIVLWNTIVDYPSLYGKESSSVLDMVQGEYYLLLNFRESMPQNVNFPITVNLYDKDRNVIVTETRNLYVEKLPKITATLDKYSDGIIGKGELVPITIVAENINSEVTWKMISGDGKQIINSFSYLDKNGNVVHVDSNEIINLNEKYYIDTSTINYGYYDLVFNGSREINGTSFGAEEKVRIQIVVFTLEDVFELDAVDDVVTIKNATIKTLKAVVTLNDSAYTRTAGGIVEVTEIEKYNALIDAISNSIDGINWYVYNDNGYEKLVAEKIYSGFKFSVLDEICKIRALSVSTNRLRLTFHYYYDESGDVVVTNKFQVDNYTVYMFDYYFQLVIEDNSTEDHPNPINTQEDLEKMQEGASYILQNDIDLISWRPMDFKANYLDGNGYTINIKSLDLTNEKGSTEAYVGVFRTIAETGIVKNLNINVSDLLVSSSVLNSMKNGLQKPNIDLRETEAVYFGVLAGLNEGIVINVKIVNFNLLNNNSYLYVAMNTGYYSVGDSQTLATGYIGGLLGQNNGVVADSMVGVRNTKYITTSVSKDSSSKQTQVNGFKLAGSNRVGGLVSYNSGTISNSFISDVGIVNNATINNNSHTAGFVGQNTGKIYSCAVTTNSLVDYRADKTVIESFVSVGGFVYLNSGKIEDCYTNIQIYDVSTATAGFVYENAENGEVVNSYTTSKNTAIDKNSNAHSMFVGIKPMAGSLKNCYYAIVNNELGLGANADLEVLRVLDPAIGINLISNSVVAKSYFDGFTFASNDSSVDGVWLYNENALPTLANCEYVEIYTCRELLSAPSAYFEISIDDAGNGSVRVYDLNKQLLTTSPVVKNDRFTYYGIEFFKLNGGSDDIWAYISTVNGNNAAYTLTSQTIGDKKLYFYNDTLSAQNGTEALFNYAYARNNPGSRNNPLIVTSAEDFAKNVVTNTQKIKVNTDYKFVFGGKYDDIDSSIARYVKIVRDLDFSDNKITYKYKYSGASASDSPISISDVVFNGVLIGNSMTLSNIYLVKESVGDNKETENWGIFSQIGLGDNTNASANAFVFNLKLGYREVSGENVQKVGVLAGTINNATISKITISGPQDIKEGDVVSGKYLAGALAGLITGDNTRISEITTSNVRVLASYVTDTKSDANEAFNLTDNFNIDDVTYSSFSYTDIDSREHKIQFNPVSLNYNIDFSKFNVSYAGAIAGAIVGDSENDFNNDFSTPNIYKKDSEDSKDLKDPTYAQIRDGRATIQNITVKDNLSVSSVVSGGLFGYAGGKTSDTPSSVLVIKDAKLVLNAENNNQNIYGMGYAGGLVGYSYRLSLVECTVEHSDVIQQNIDSKINTITSINVSSNDLFTNSLGDGTSRNIAIGGLIGYTNETAIIDSYAKVNVVNTNSYIAGGLVGRSVNMLYMAYCYTIGNVDASTMIGGIIGYKLYGVKNASKQDLYLINVIGANIWSSKVVEYVTQNNDFIVKGELKHATMSMFEIGNDMPDGYSYTKSSNNYKFRYLGSVIGRVTYQALDSTSGNAKEEPEVNLNTSDTEYVGAIKKFGSLSSQDRVVNAGALEEHYVTYYNENFFNVISSTYGAVSHTGSLNNDNYTSTISKNALLPAYRTVESHKENYTKVLIGKQYYISYITGDFLLSSPTADNLGNFKNEFVNNWSYVADISNKQYGDIPNLFGNSADINPSTIWYVESALYLPRYGYNTNSNVEIIANKEDLKSALTFGYKDKIYRIKKYVFTDDKVEVSSDATLIAKADEIGAIEGSFEYGGKIITFKKIDYTGIAITSDDINLSNCVFVADGVVTVGIKLGASAGIQNRNGFYNILSGCGFTNIHFVIDASARIGSQISTSQSESALGLFANSISGCSFADCTFEIKGANINLVDSIDRQVVSSFGGVIGKSLRSSFVNCNVISNIASISSETENVANIGGMVGSFVSSSINGLSYKVPELTTTIKTKMDTIAVGGLIGSSQGSVISGVKNSQSYGINANITKGSATKNIYVGGVIGRAYYEGSNISNSTISGVSIGNVMVANKEAVKTAGTLSLGVMSGYSAKTAYNDIVLKGCEITHTGNTLVNNEYIGLLTGVSTGGAIEGAEVGYNESSRLNGKIGYTTTSDECTSKTVAIGGVVGYAESHITKATNTALIQINVVDDNRFAKALVVGGIIGYYTLTNGTIVSSFNLANIDLTVENCCAITKTTARVGGLIGQTGGVTAFEYCVNYGDIKYCEKPADKEGNKGVANENFVLGGIVGYAERSLKLNYVVDYTRFFASVQEVTFVEKNDEGKETTTTNEVKVKMLNFSAITKGLKVAEGSSDYYFISEFDPASASDGSNKNLVNSHVSYGKLDAINPFRMSAVDGSFVFVNFISDRGYINIYPLVAFTTNFTDYSDFYDLLSKVTNYNDKGNKNNPNHPDDSIPDSFADYTYTVFKAGRYGGYERKSTNPRLLTLPNTAISIGNGAIVTSDNTIGGFQINTRKAEEAIENFESIKTNKGVISNILFNFSTLTKDAEIKIGSGMFAFFITNNYGDIYNVAFAGGLKDDNRIKLSLVDSGTSGISFGPIGNNYGGIYKSGTSITYNEASTISGGVLVSNFVISNYGVMAESYTTSSFDSSNSNGKDKLGALCYSNNGTVKNCFAGGRWGNSYITSKEAIKINNGISRDIGDCRDGELSEYIFKNSSYKSEDEKDEKPIWIVANRNFKINNGNPYIRNGIEIPTDPFGLAIVNIKTLAEFKNMLTAFNAYNDTSGAVVPIGNGKEQKVILDVYGENKKITRPFTLNISENGTLTGKLSYTTLPNALVSTNSGTITELKVIGVTVNYGSTYYASILAEKMEKGNSATINIITIEKCTLNLNDDGATNGYAGGVVGYVCGGEIKNITLTGTTIKGVSDTVGGVVGYSENKTIGKNDTTMETISFDGTISVDACYVGGIVGYTLTESMNNCFAYGKITISNTININVRVGGVIGYCSKAMKLYNIGFGGWQDDKSKSSISITGLKTEYARVYVGGIIGEANEAPEKGAWWIVGCNEKKQVDIALTASSYYYYAGGLIGIVNRNSNSYSYTLDDFSHISINASGAKAKANYADNEYLKGKTIRELFFDGIKYNDSIYGDVSWYDYLTFYTYNKNIVGDIYTGYFSYVDKKYMQTWEMRSRVVAVQNKGSVCVGRVVGQACDDLINGISDSDYFKCEITNLRSSYTILRLNTACYDYATWVFILGWFDAGNDYTLELLYVTRDAIVTENIDATGEKICGNGYLRGANVDSDLLKDDNFKNYIGQNNMDAHWANKKNNDTSKYNNYISWQWWGLYGGNTAYYDFVKYLEGKRENCPEVILDNKIFEDVF